MAIIVDDLARYGSSPTGCEGGLVEPIELLGKSGKSAVWDGTTLTIRHRRAERSIPATSITAVEFRGVAGLGEGYIRFVVDGAPASRHRAGSRMSAIRDDEWALVFASWIQRRAQALREAVEEAIAARSRVPGLATADGIADQLERLAALHRGGQLTDDEFDAAKQRLLTQ